jgi:hypothetical protein
MKRLLAGLFLCVLLVSCGTERSEMQADSGADVVAEAANTLALKWERFTYGDRDVCQRCMDTGTEIRRAFQRLSADLASVGVDVELDEDVLSGEEAAADMCRSNSIWIAGKPLETWLGAEVGESHCKGCCEAMGSDVLCRTITYEGKTYEAIPADLIVTAAYAAASEMIGRDIKPCDSGSGICTCGTGAPCPAVEAGGHGCAHEAGAAGTAKDAGCSASCTGKGADCSESCPGKAAQTKKTSCPRASSCGSTTCPAAGG